ncbi:hypothetical protein T10_11507 [Trichinella papuae]|uniref:Uncharacterized protein n=1 Tax=Trichinella papuae TaxID=268474 RepID=A0A0V1LXB6_9BILA|nr:hypothetical protein T10_11507 [Trichinella papuae]
MLFLHYWYFISQNFSPFSQQAFIFLMLHFLPAQNY